MRYLDRFLQNWRAKVARPWIPSGSQVLDVGCHQGEFLKSLGDQIGPSIGIDPLASLQEGPRYRILPETFHEPVPFSDRSFDTIVLLATLEHIRDKEPLGCECQRLLRPGGRVIITVPSPFVDRIIDMLTHLRLADGMSLDEHHGYDPRSTPELFERHGLFLEHHGTFQCGLNHLFVFRKPAPHADRASEAAPTGCSAGGS
ncbi:MAG: methyltransferase domain-containing protein [Isosphaeraceae bacterium]